MGFNLLVTCYETMQLFLSVENFTKQTRVKTVLLVCRTTHFLLVAEVVGLPPTQICTNPRYKEAL